MLSVCKFFTFEAAHKLPEYQGKCAYTHGHSYKLEIEVTAYHLKKGMIVDFKVIKQIVQPLVDLLDHQYINEVDAFPDRDNPTAENMVGWMVKNLEPIFEIEGLILCRVRLWETVTCYAEWRKDG